MDIAEATGRNQTKSAHKNEKAQIICSFPFILKWFKSNFSPFFLPFANRFHFVGSFSFFVCWFYSTSFKSVFLLVSFRFRNDRELQTIWMMVIRRSVIVRSLLLCVDNVLFPLRWKTYFVSKSKIHSKEEFVKHNSLCISPPERTLFLLGQTRCSSFSSVFNEN